MSNTTSADSKNDSALMSATSEKFCLETVNNQMPKACPEKLQT